MSIFGGLFGDDNENTNSTNNTNTNESTNNDATLQLRKEELDITKSKVQKGEVELSKEIIEEQKCVDVPITREEVVIERKPLNNETCDAPIANEAPIRIPVSEEKVDVNKRTVVTEEISAHKQPVEATQHIDETIRREEARVNTTGNPNVIDNSANNNQ